jgi:hypothetical protein
MGPIATIFQMLRCALAVWLSDDRGGVGMREGNGICRPRRRILSNHAVISLHKEMARECMRKERKGLSVL